MPIPHRLRGTILSLAIKDTEVRRDTEGTETDGDFFSARSVSQVFE